ncbi:MAG: hypothetical protein FGF48_01035 [Candidatus Brockarchaeota archaeon]|nr:hypothetical protein [Candidatus Brockarchaeota archaeon]
MGEIKVSGSRDYRGLLKKAAGIVLAVFLVYLGFSAWLFTVSVYDNMYSVKSGVSYLNIMFLNGNLFTALGVLIGIAVLNPFLWHSVLKRRFKTAALILFPSILLAFVFFSAVGSQIAVQILLLNKAGSFLQSYLGWLGKIYFGPFSFSGEELYGMMPVFDFIQLMKMLYVFSTAIVFISLAVNSFQRIVILMKKAAAWPQGDLIVLDFTRTVFSLLRFIVSAVFIGFFLFWYPSLTYDVTSPIFRLALTISVILVILQILLETVPFKKPAMVKNILLVLAVVIAILGYALPQAYYRTLGGWDANKVSYEFNSRIKPHIELVKLLNGLNEVSETTQSLGSLSDLEKVRLTNHDFISSRTRYELSRRGIPWITGSEPSMIYFKDGRLYWVVFTAPVMVEATDVETAESFIYTHSEVILAFDATTGRTVSLSQALGMINAPPVYYGLGGLFREREIVFVNTGKWREAGTVNYTGSPDYVFSGWVRAAYFLLKGRLDIASGGYGDTLNALITRDAYERVSAIKAPLLVFETDPRTGVPAPYPVVDPDGNLYLAFSTFVEKPVYTEYAATEKYGVENGGCLRRLFSIILVNVADGSIQGYMFEESLGSDNYVVNALKSLYPSWVRPIPSWLKPQLRYIKNLMWSIIDIYNTYRISSSDYDSWYRSTGMLDYPRDSSGNIYSQSVFDIRYVSLEGRYVALCIVENYQQNPGASVNIVGAYVFTPYSKEFILFQNRVPRLSAIMDSILHHPTVQQILTLHQTRGVSWVEGNLMVQLVNNTPVFILPFYSISAQVAYVTMVVVYNPQISRIGIYQVANVDDWVEVSRSTLVAYVSTLPVNITVKPDYLQQVKAFLVANGLHVAEPVSVSANVAYRIGYVKAEEFQSKANTTLAKLVEFCRQHGLKTVNMWVERVGDKDVINVGALIMTVQGVELHLVQIETS